MAKRKPIFGGNWKAQVINFRFISDYFADSEGKASEFSKEIPQIENAEVFIAPPFPFLHFINEENRVLQTGIETAAQNVYFEDKGAYTGEVTGQMLKNLEVDYVIVGHSERRHIFGDSNATVGKKARAVYLNQMTPILCVGEKLEQRKSGKHFEVVKRQFRDTFSQFGNSVSLANMDNLVIAYEPVWAIGTGETATPEQAQEMHHYIRQLLQRRWGSEIAQNVRIIYGGSVKPDNIEDLMKQPDIDGALVGGASLNPKSFYEIIKKGVEAHDEGYKERKLNLDRAEVLALSMAHQKEKGR